LDPITELLFFSEEYRILEFIAIYVNIYDTCL